jgi:hypothetical protein
MAFTKEFTNYGAACRNHLTIRASGKLFIPRNIITDRLDIKMVSHYKILLDDEDQYRLGIKLSFLTPGVNDFRSKRKVSVEKSGVTLNIAPVLSSLGVHKIKQKMLIPYTIEDALLVINVKEFINFNTGEKTNA